MVAVIGCVVTCLNFKSEGIYIYISSNFIKRVARTAKIGPEIIFLRLFPRFTCSNLGMDICKHDC